MESTAQGGGLPEYQPRTKKQEQTTHTEVEHVQQQPQQQLVYATSL